MTIESLHDEEFLQPKPSSWLAALSQLPGFASEQTISLPQPAGRAREVTSELEEDLEGGEDLEEPLQ